MDHIRSFVIRVLYTKVLKVLIRTESNSGSKRSNFFMIDHIKVKKDTR